MNIGDFDLDINNYTKNDIISFFKLTPNFSAGELESHEKELRHSILDSKYDAEYKDTILNFISKAKEVMRIYKRKQEYEDENEHNDDTYNNVGKVIMPLSRAQAMQTQSIPRNNINGYGINIYRQNYVFDTRYRDDFFQTSPTKCSFTLPIKLNNVIEMTLSAVQFPNTFFTFNNDLKTNELYIFEETTNNEGIVILPEGNYNVEDFPLQFEKAINEQIVGVYIPGGPNRFTVSISEFTRFTTITNSTYNFRMNIIKKTPTTDVCSEFIPVGKYTVMDFKKGISQAAFFQTMGYQIGYRSIEYIGKNSYTSESQFDSTFVDFVYFTLNEHNPDSIHTTTVGVLPESVVDKNILGVIPITSPAFTNTFDNGANFIYKTRHYLAPIKIQKISIELVNRVGGQINLHNNDFAFCLELQTIYDNVEYSHKSTL